MLIPLDYLINKYEFKPKGILHLGGSYAQESDAYNQVGIDEVLWVEAIPDVFEQLKRNVSKYPNNKCFNACIGDEDGKEVIFNVSNNECQSSSFLKLGYHQFIHPTVKYVSSFNTKTIKADTLFKDYSFGKGWFLNADLQGAELHALRGMTNILPSFDFIYLELNKRETYEGCALVDDVDKFLKDFKRVETGFWVGDSWTDGFYIRKTLL